MFLSICVLFQINPKGKAALSHAILWGHDGNRSSTQPSPFPNLMNAGIAPQVPCQVIPKAE